MGLLTRDERKTLTPEARRELRAKRRAERPARGINIKINWDALLKIAESMILDVVADQIPGEQKMTEICDQLAIEADDLLKWEGLGVIGALLEAIDGPIITALFGALVRPQVQALYARLKADGKL